MTMAGGWLVLGRGTKAGRKGWDGVVVLTKASAKDIK